MRKHLTSMLFFAFASLSSAQIKVALNIPLIQYQATNVGEIKNGFVKQYYNKDFIPNFELKMHYNKFLVGFNHHYSTVSNPNKITEDGTLQALQFKSVSFFTGYTFIEKGNFNIKSGIGYTLFDSWAGSYVEIVPRELWGGKITTREKPNTLLIWNEVSYKILPRINIGLSSKFNPMLKPFKDPVYGGGHDRIHLFTSQITLGYFF